MRKCCDSYCRFHYGPRSVDDVEILRQKEEYIYN